jgi:hypothetical protein
MTILAVTHMKFMLNFYLLILKINTKQAVKLNFETHCIEFKGKYQSWIPYASKSNLLFISFAKLKSLQSKSTIKSMFES